MKIGVFTAGLDEYYQLSICSGLEACFFEKPVDLIYYVGERLNSPFLWESQANILYDLALTNHLDGLIVLSGALSGYAESNQSLDFYRSFSSVIPTLSIGVEVKGMPSFVTDNKGGIGALMEHLFIHHNKKRTVILAGPDKHPEAQIRYKEYLEAIKKLDIPFDDNLIVRNGNFLYSGGEEGIERLLDRNIDFDSVLSFNDEMAIGAIRVLKKRGYRIPEDIAVCGFDNNPESLFTNPSLTTVSQPGYRMGFSAAQSLFEWISLGIKPQEITSCSIRLILRHSCGCLNTEKTILQRLEKEKNIEQRLALNTSFWTDILSSLSGRDEIIFLTNEIIKSRDVSVILDNLGRIQDVFEKNRIRHDFVINSHQIIVYLKSISIFFLNQNNLGKKRTKELSKIVDYLAKMETRLSHKNFQEASLSLLKIQKNNHNLGNMSSEFISCFDFYSLSGILSRWLPVIKIEEFYLVFYGEREESQRIPFWSKLVFAYKDNRSWNYGEEGLQFATKNLLPEPFIKNKNPRSLLVHSLFFQEDQYGYVVYKRSEDTPYTSFMALSQQLRSALRVLGFIKNQKEFSEKLERKVFERTKELEKLNNDLKKEIIQRKNLQKKMLQIEDKERSRIGQELHDDICQRLGGISMLSLVLKNELSSEKQALSQKAGMISRLMDETLHSTRQLSRGLFPVVLANDGLKEALEELCNNLNFQYKVPIDVHISTIDSLQLLSKNESLNLYRIAQEALNNALRHSGASQLILTMEPFGKEIILTISDNGKGFPPRDTLVEGVGLKSIKNRAQVIGAHLTIRSDTGIGSKVICQFTKELS